MKVIHSVILKNVSIPVNEFKLNEFIRLRRIDHDRTRLLTMGSVEDKEKFRYEGNIILAFRSLQMYLSDIQIHLEADKEFSNGENDFIYDFLKDSASFIINVYGSQGLDILSTSDYKRSLTESELESLKGIHQDIIIPFNISTSEALEENNLKSNRWYYAYQQYLGSCRSITVDESVLKIITGLEALLVKGDGLLKYKVSLYASLILEENSEDRRRIFKLIGKMYNLRSKIVHGEIESVNKMLKKPDVFENYFELKTIFSRLLVKLFLWEEESVFERLEEVIFKAPKF